MDAHDASVAAGLDHVQRRIGDDVLAEITAELAITAELHDRTGSFPHENFDVLRRHGVVGLQAARDLSGDPLDLAQARRIITAVARGEPSTALVLVMTWLFSLEIARNSNWPAALREQVLQDIAVSGTLANFLRVEPALGTPARGGLPETTAKRVAGGWRLSGHKLYSTGIPALGWLGVWGRTDDAEPLVGNFLVPGNAPGIRIVETWDQLGMRASGSHDAVFEDVFIPEAHAVDIRPADAWQTSWGPEYLTWMSVLLGAIYDAVARNARDWLVQFALSRQPSNLGATLSTLARYQEAVGEIDAMLYTSAVMLDHASAAAIGEISAIQCNFVKRNVTNNAIKVAEKALALVGNPGLSRANPLQRYYRDTLYGRVHSPQDDMILTGAGKFAFASFKPITAP